MSVSQVVLRGSAGRGVGPTNPAGTTWSESFNGATDSVALSSSNSAYGLFAGPGISEFETARSYRTGTCARFATTSQIRQAIRVFPAATGLEYERCYMFITAYPSVLTAIRQARLFTTPTAHLWLAPSGKIQLRDATTVAGFTVAAVPLLQWFRIEWLLNGGVSQTLRLFKGSNVEGRIPTDEVIGALTATTFDRIYDGIGTSSTFEIFVDEVAGNSSTWPGP